MTRSENNHFQWHTIYVKLGGGVIISLVMLRSRDFSKVTAIAGLLGNTLDLTKFLGSGHSLVENIKTNHLATYYGT